jgi:hypothetical protein
MSLRGDYPPIMIDESAKKIVEQVASSLFPDKLDWKFVKINPNKAVEHIELYQTNGWPNLTEGLCIMIVFMVLNCNLLTPNTNGYLRPIDAKWCEELDATAGYNWCKIVFDNLRESGRKWKLNRKLGITWPAILGCSIFLIVSTTCNLSCSNYLISAHMHIHYLTWWYNVPTQIFYLDNL